MLRDKESDYNWDRTGEPVVEVIGEILECDEEIAKDVQSILSEKHDRYSPRDGYDGECEFSSESLYELKSKRSINPTRYSKDGEIRYSSRAPAPLESLTRTTGQLAVGLAPAPPPSTRWICFY